MKVGGPTNLQRGAPTARTAKAGKAQQAGATNAAAGASAPRQINDVVSVQSIPLEEMTPKVQAAFQTLMEEVQTLRVELDVAHRRLAEIELLADTDPLAPISNRRAFVRELTRMIAFAERYGTPSTLVFFDVNDLKIINDELGHAAGDQALMHIAQILLRSTRDSDVVGRLGGDEFGVVLAQADETVGLQKAEALANTIEETAFDFEGESLHVHVAHGAYTFRTGESATDALQNADRRMYEKKRAMKTGEGPGEDGDEPASGDDVGK